MSEMQKIIAGALGASIMLFSFYYFTKTKEPEKVILYVLQDVTNPDVGYQKYIPSTRGEVLAKVFDVTQNKKGFYEFKDAPKYGEINFYPINGEVAPIDYTFSVPAITEASPILRSNAIKKLFPGLKVAFNYYGDEFSSDHPTTEFYRGFVSQANRLAKQDVGINGRKVMILFTDMLENSDLAKFYAVSNIPTCKELGKSKVWKKMRADSKLKDLTGIEFYLVSRIADQNQKKLYVQAAKFWKCIIEGYGGEVVSLASTLKIPD